MKKQICILLLLLISTSAFTQTVFPGLSEAQKQKLLNTKIPVPLPTWVPKGFVVTNIIAKTGKSFKIENKVLTITYDKKLDNGSLQFTVEAGFEGIGDMPYNNSEIIKSKVGNIYLYYEPIEEDIDGRKLIHPGFIQTEWFDIKNLAFNVSFSYQNDNKRINRTNPKISKGDAKKILQSMQVLK
ncbi:MAG: hypothetical protein JWN83_2385 [Chitinophagaceae bacterium]|nr:hypothetical protein [Chitinophagaceae bacterium]